MIFVSCCLSRTCEREEPVIERGDCERGNCERDLGKEETEGELERDAEGDTEEAEREQ